MLKVGQKVKVDLPTFRDSGISTGMHKYNGKTFTVVETVHYNGYGKDSYVLDGCVSPCGINYEFIDEWLVAVESEGSDDTEG